MPFLIYVCRGSCSLRCVRLPSRAHVLGNREVLTLASDFWRNLGPILAEEFRLVHLPDHARHLDEIAIIDHLMRRLHFFSNCGLLFTVLLIDLQEPFFTATVLATCSLFFFCAGRAALRHYPNGLLLRLLRRLLLQRHNRCLKLT